MFPANCKRVSTYCVNVWYTTTATLNISDGFSIDSNNQRIWFCFELVSLLLNTRTISHCLYTWVNKPVSVFVSRVILNFNPRWIFHKSNPNAEHFQLLPKLLFQIPGSADFVTKKFKMSGSFDPLNRGYVLFLHIPNYPLFYIHHRIEYENHGVFEYNNPDWHQT